MASILQNFSAMSNGKKLLYLLVLAASIGGVAALYIWANQPEFKILYANLSEEDASAVVQKLQAGNIPYRLDGTGSIKVPAGKIYETRLDLASQGIPNGGRNGFELFDKSGLGISEFAQRINYVRAVQGELERTIGWLVEVKAARVHIVMPKKRLFLAKEERSSASVVLRLMPGMEMSSEQVRSVTQLVSNSVRGLRPQDVSIIDTEGRLLSKNSNKDGEFSVASSQLAYKKEVEKGLVNRIQDVLAPIVGAGRVVARVSADVDFRRIDRTEEKFDPDSVVVRSEQRKKEKSKNLKNIVSGVPGVMSNTPGTSKNNSSSLQPSTRQSEDEVINYEINSVRSRIVESTGIIKRLSVAVVVDGKYESVNGATDEKKGTSYLSRSSEEMKKIERLVKGAVGFDGGRGDTVEVIDSMFDTQSGAIAMPEEESGSAIVQYLKHNLSLVVRYGTILFLSMILFLFVLRPLIKALTREGASGGGTPEGVRDESMLPAGAGSMELQAGEGERREALPAPPDQRQKVMELAGSNPKQAAKIIREWVKEK